jgi:hypothetical protein
MNVSKTVIAKNHYGMFAETSIEMPNNKVLIFRTARRYTKDLVTCVSVYKKGNGCITQVVGEEYAQSVNHGSVGRLTVNIMKDRHACVLTAHASYYKEAIEFYSKKEVNHAN